MSDIVTQLDAALRLLFDGRRRGGRVRRERTDWERARGQAKSQRRRERRLREVAAGGWRV